MLENPKYNPQTKEVKAVLLEKSQNEIIKSYRMQTKTKEYYLKFKTQNNKVLSFTVDKITFDRLKQNQKGTLQLLNNEFYNFK